MKDWEQSIQFALSTQAQTFEKDIEAVRDIMLSWQLVLVTADNCAGFGIPLLAARLQAAQAKGKHLVVDGRNRVSIVDTPPKSPAFVDYDDMIVHGSSTGQVPQGIINCRCANEITEENAETQTIAPRNRGERRHGVKAPQPCWQKDWRTR